jgi:hypothetical protein
MNAVPISISLRGKNLNIKNIDDKVLQVEAILGQKYTIDI